MRKGKEKPSAATDGGKRDMFKSEGRYTPMIAQHSREIKPPGTNEGNQQAYNRCPGCFGWFPQLNLIYYPPNYLDDNLDYELCPQCDHVIKTGKKGAVQNTIRNIGSYAGWSNEE